MLRGELFRFDDDSSYPSPIKQGLLFLVYRLSPRARPRAFGQVGLLETLSGFLRALRLEVIAFIESLLTPPALVL
jgi:hypothetical protein